MDEPLRNIFISPLKSDIHLFKSLQLEDVIMGICTGPADGDYLVIRAHFTIGDFC